MSSCTPASVQNVYLEEFEASMQNCPPEMHRIFDPELPLARRRQLLDWNLQHQLRLRQKYAYGLPDPRTLALIAQFSPLVEIGAGTGYWAMLLAGMGVEIAAYDHAPLLRKEKDGEEEEAEGSPARSKKRRRLSASSSSSSSSGEEEAEEEDSPEHFRYHEGAMAFYDVLEGGPEMVSRHPDSTLFLCWPPDSNDMAAQCLANYRGEYVLFVGELFSESVHGSFGLTGTPEFHVRLALDFHPILKLPQPNWPLCNGTFTVWKRTRFAIHDDSLWSIVPPSERLEPVLAASAEGKELLERAEVQLNRMASSTIR